MICNKPSYVGDKKCIRYWGEHEELRDMLKVGDIVTLVWQNDDKSESIKVTGPVTRCGLDSVDVRTRDDEEEYIFDNPNILAKRKYTITRIRRPLENMLPDSPGPWLDKDDATWIVNADLNAIRVSYDGDWLIGGGIFLPSEYAEYAPFKKINIIKEKASNE